MPPEMHTPSALQKSIESPMTKWSFTISLLGSLRGQSSCLTLFDSIRLSHRGLDKSFAKLLCWQLLSTGLWAAERQSGNITLRGKLYQRIEFWMLNLKAKGTKGDNMSRHCEHFLAIDFHCPNIGVCVLIHLAHRSLACHHVLELRETKYFDSESLKWNMTWRTAGNRNQNCHCQGAHYKFWRACVGCSRSFERLGNFFLRFCFFCSWLFNLCLLAWFNLSIWPFTVGFLLFVHAFRSCSYLFAIILLCALSHLSLYLSLCLCLFLAWTCTFALAAPLGCFAAGRFAPVLPLSSGTLSHAAAGRFMPWLPLGSCGFGGGKPEWSLGDLLYII